MCMAFPFSKPYFNRKKQGLKHAFGRVAVARESSVCPPPPAIHRTTQRSKGGMRRHSQRQNEGRGAQAAGGAQVPGGVRAVSARKSECSRPNLRRRWDVARGTVA